MTSDDLTNSRFSGHVISSRLYCNPKALWKFNWFLSDFGYDVELLGRDEVDETQLIGLTDVVKISHVVLNGTSVLRLDGFAPRKPLAGIFARQSRWLARGLMNYSYTQISQYLTCPRRYHHRYLDGWQEKDIRAAMLFGRAFEQALLAYFLREDAAAVLFRERSLYQKQGLHYSKGDIWDRAAARNSAFGPILPG
jgi:hypothetical protein